MQRRTGWTAIAVLWCGIGLQAQEATVPRGPHGAAEEAYQAKVFDMLGTNLNIPAGVSEKYWNAMIPKGNEATPERVALGKKLYFDTRLSADGTVSCATCHDVTRGFTDQIPTSEGIRKQFGKRNAPTNLNAGVLHNMFWDGRSPSLDHQAMQPIINPVEMGVENDEATIIAPIKDDPEYQKMFQAAYGRDVNYADIGLALGAFERTLNFFDSPFRRYLAGDENAISADAKEGWKLFNREGRCVTCHTMSPSNPVGSDSKFHNIGIAAKKQNFEELARTALHALEQNDSEEELDRLAIATDMSELGRFMVTKEKADIGAFRTPLLTNIGITGPYMHDGSLATLWDVVDHYNKGGEPNLYLDGGMEPLNLTDRQVDQLVAFLFSLTDVRFAQQNAKMYAEQKALAATSRSNRDTEKATRKVLTFEDYSRNHQPKGAEK
ncbi:MAG: cytochrome c peroxidase [Planctomycetia bacterium]|nr:cytochrome c peroxidase [Planctomycetia bacterium]